MLTVTSYAFLEIILKESKVPQCGFLPVDQRRPLISNIAGKMWSEVRRLTTVYDHYLSNVIMRYRDVCNFKLVCIINAAFNFDYMYMKRIDCLILTV